jgi:glycerol-3-phosphate acyltransferase PlsY
MIRLILVLGSYLLGSVPFAYLITRLKTGKDIRQMGSGNVGATNVMRTTGKAAGLAALILDTGKGAAVVWLGTWLTGQPVWGAIAAFAAMVGHSFPVFLGFRGGKSVATGGGAFLVLSPFAMLCSIGVFILTVAAVRIVALGSILATACFPLFAWLFGTEKPVVLWGALSALLIVVRHHANIRRMLRGEEKRMGEPKRG